MRASPKVAAILVGVALLLTVGVGTCFWAFQQVKDAAVAREQSNLVIDRANDLLSEVRDAETGQRGFSLTGNEVFLEPYVAVRDSVRPDLRELRQLTVIPAAQQHLDAIAPLLDAKMQELADVIALRRNQDIPAVIARVSTGRGKQLMDDLRGEMAAFLQVERAALAQREAEYQRNLRRLFALIAAASLVTLLLVFSCVVLLTREARQAVRNRAHLETKHLLDQQTEASRQLQLALASVQISQERLAVTLQSIGDAVIATDAAGRVTLLNPVAEALTGWTQLEASDQRVDEIFCIINKDSRLPAIIPVADTLAHGTVHGLANHTILIARGGAECDIADSCAPIRDRDHQVIGAVLVFRDVTQEYAAKHALELSNVELARAKIVADKANLAKSDFLSRMSHELRTPLNAILGFAQLLETATPAPTPVQNVRIAQILQAGWHLLNLINEILDLAMIESGKVSLSQEPVSLTAALADCQAMMEPQAHQRGIRLTYPSFDRPAFVWADRTRLKQIIINLLSNAIKYNKHGGTVVVDIAQISPGRTRLGVTDSGSGLSTEKLAQLFEPFNRLGQEAGGESGTGIGLVVTKQLAELMGGELGVESTVGAGCRFWIELRSTAAPTLDADILASLAPIPARSSAATRQRTLLYVEDNPANMLLVEQLIAQHSNLKMLTAVDGTLGIQLARSALPAVILMDINLPGLSGTDAMKILRDDPATAHIPVVALSANAMPRDVEKGLEAGFFSYLTKPIKIKEFNEALNTAIKFSEKSAAPAAPANV